jgi:hypothetical protein
LDTGTAAGSSAFLDESQSEARIDPHTYILAAVICKDFRLAEIRSRIAALKLRGQVKLHWRSESDKRRQLIAETFASLPLECLVVVRDGRVGERAERRRRHCLDRMFCELDQLGVTSAVFESRGAKDDRRDLEMLQFMRGRKAVSSRLRIEHKPGPAEAMLWLADAACGAVVKHRVGDSSYLTTIQSGIITTLFPIAPN